MHYWPREVVDACFIIQHEAMGTTPFDFHAVEENLSDHSSCIELKAIPAVSAVDNVEKETRSNK